METQFKVITTGKLLDGLGEHEVTDRLVSMTNLNHKQAERLIGSGKPALIRKGLSRQDASRFKKKFEQAGLEIRILQQREGSAVQGSQSKEPAVEPPTQATPPETPPSPPKKPEPTPVATADNLYSAPKAELKKSKPAVEEWLKEPRKVPPSHGWRWISSAFSMFLGAPWKWMGMSVVAVILVSLLNLIPLVGPILYQFVFVIVVGGFMMAANRQAFDQEFGFAYIFKGFTTNRNQLLMISVIYLLMMLLLLAAMALVVGGSIFGLIGVGEFNPDDFSSAMADNVALVMLLICISALLFIPIMMGYWFSVPLVSLCNYSAWSAFKMSLKACARNWLPFLVYAFIGLIIFVGGFGLFGVIVGIGTAVLSDIAAILIPVATVLIILAMMPLMVVGGLSAYTSFRDIFLART